MKMTEDQWWALMWLIDRKITDAVSNNFEETYSTRKAEAEAKDLFVGDES